VKKEIIILTLLFTIYLITTIEAPLKEINETSIGDYVRLRGVISDYANPDRLTIFNLVNGNQSIKTILFSESNTWDGALVEVTGRVTEYKGERELTGVKITFLE
jgi:RecJ-like exonuclease